MKVKITLFKGDERICHLSCEIFYDDHMVDNQEKPYELEKEKPGSM